MKNVEIFHSMAYDFLAGMYRLNNFETMYKGRDMNLEVSFKINEEIDEWARTTRAKMTEDMLQLLDKFFNMETFYGMCLVSLIPFNKLNSAEKFIAFAAELETGEILERFLGTGYGAGDIEIDRSILEKLLKDEKYAFSFISENLSIPSRNKWDLMEFFMNPESMKSDLMRLFNWYYDNVFKYEVTRIEGIVTRHERELKEKLERYGEDYLTLLTGINQSKGKSKTRFIFSISYYYEVSNLHSSRYDENTEIYMLGYRYMELNVENRHAVLSGVQIFKSLGDETRLNIAMLLSKRPWYGHELAQELKLSNSTISHHLSILMLGGFVRSEREDNRVYYSLDVENMKKIIWNSIDEMMK